MRERLARLLDAADGFVEDGLPANALAGDLPADGVVTGIGTVGGRTVAVMANDSTVKAAWGARTVEKILRVQEYALRHEVPMLWLVDSAGARITDQVEMFPAGAEPEDLLQPGAAVRPGAAGVLPVRPVGGGRGLHPRLLRRRLHGRRQRLDVPGLAPHGRDGDRREDDPGGDGRGGHALPGVGLRRPALRRRGRGHPGRPPLPRLLPGELAGDPPAEAPAGPAYPGPVAPLVPTDESQPFDVYPLVAAVVDEESFFEIKREFAAEVVCGLGRIEGRAVGLVANQPAVKGGVLFVDSADKVARFVWLCDAFNLPLVFLADVPGSIGTEVERQGIIRHGAKLITAVSEATVPKICVVVRKAYGAGLYAMAGPGFEPDATLALPTASIAVMGPEAAVNAVYYNKLAASPRRSGRPRSSGCSASTARTSSWSAWPRTWSWTRSSTPTTSAPSWPGWPLLQARSGTSLTGGTESHLYDGPALPFGAGGQPGRSPCGC